MQLAAGSPPHQSPPPPAAADATDGTASVAPFRFRFIPGSARTLPSRELRPLCHAARECRASWRRRARRLWCD